MIYYNNKKIVKAYYGLKDVDPVKNFQITVEVEPNTATGIGYVKNNNNGVSTEIQFSKYSDTLYYINTIPNTATNINIILTNKPIVKKMLNVNMPNNPITDCTDLIVNPLSLQGIRFEKFNTSKITKMGNMFEGCEDITELDISEFDTSNVTDMSNMFGGGLRQLLNLDVSNFITNKVTDMSSMFSHLYKITSLDLSNFDTSNVTNMYNMFFGCFKLTDINLSSFVTSNVTDMGSMFYDCKELVTLDLSNFDVTKLKNNGLMGIFNGCVKLETVKCKQLFKDKLIAHNPNIDFSSINFIIVD